MKAVIQRVKKAGVKIDNETYSQIAHGLVILVGIEKDDTADDAMLLAQKIANLRIFEDEAGKMNLSIKDVQGEILVVSQFTLCADLRRGRRPSFTDAAEPAIAVPIYEKFVFFLQNEGITVKTGKFAAKMLVEIFNDGPVTFYLESKGLR